MIGFLAVAWLSVSLIKLLFLFDTIDSIQEPITIFLSWVSLSNRPKKVEKRKEKKREKKLVPIQSNAALLSLFSFYHLCASCFRCGLSLRHDTKKAIETKYEKDALQNRVRTRREREKKPIKRVINSNRFKQISIIRSALNEHRSNDVHTWIKGAFGLSASNTFEMVCACIHWGL